MELETVKQQPNLTQNGSSESEKHELEKKIAKIEIERRRIEEERDSLANRESLRKTVTWWIAKVTSLLAVIYLIWGIFSPPNIRPKAISNQDIALAFIVLLFNSGVLDKLVGLSVSSGGVEAKFKELEQGIDQNRLNILELQQKQIDEIKEVQYLIYRAVLNGCEYLTLYNLDGRNGDDLPDYAYTLLGENQLKNLFSIGFIKLKPGRSFQSFKKDELISWKKMNSYFVVTNYGKQYLDQMKKMEIEPYISD